MADTILAISTVTDLQMISEKTAHTRSRLRQLCPREALRCWRFKRSDLNQWIEELKAAVKGEAPVGDPNG